MTKRTDGVVLARYARMPQPGKQARAHAREAARRMGRAGWAGLTASARAERVANARRAGALGGRPRDRKRCYCGERSWHSAVIRRFDCCKRAGKYPDGVPMPPVPAPRR